MKTSRYIKRYRFLLVAVLALWTLLPALLAQGLPAPQGKVTFSGEFALGHAFPTLSNGFLISFGRRFDKPTTIVLNDLKTGAADAFPFWLPDATLITLYDVSIATDRRHVAATGTYTPKSGGDVNFIAVVDWKTGQVSLIRSGRYVTERICSAADGTIWTLGQADTELLHIETSPSPDYNMIRQYNLEGALKASYLSRASLGSPGIDLRPQGLIFGTTLGTSVTQAKLSCGDQSVGVFIGAPVFMWAEIDSTRTVQQWKVNPYAGLALTGLALLGRNTVYASFGANPGQLCKLSLVQSTNDPSAASATVGKATWVGFPDNSPPAGKSFALLLGSDGKALVHLRGSAPIQNDPTLYWSTP